MTVDLKEELRHELLTAATWDALVQHHERGAVLVIVGHDLVDLGYDFAIDNVARVESLLASGQLFRPETVHIDAWTATAQTFQALIVQPWVLVAPDSKAP